MHAERVAGLLKARKETVAVAESAAGGLITAALLAVPGASAYCLGGTVIYTMQGWHALRDFKQELLGGYRSATEENALILHMHELLQYLNRQGASTFLTVAQHGLVGDMKAPVDVTYLADTVVLLRYFEARGRVRRAMSVIKKRTGAHEDTIREYRIGCDGITLGEPLMGFQGVLRGVPELVGEQPPLLQDVAAE